MTSVPLSTPEPPRRWTASTDTQLSWILDELVARVPHLEKAAILSRDGLALGASADLNREDAEHLAAIAAGLSSLANGGAQHFGRGQVHQTVIDMEGGFLFVTAAGSGSCLAVLASPEADVGLIAYEMAVIVKRVGRHMAVGARPAGAGEAI